MQHSLAVEKMVLVCASMAIIFPCFCILNLGSGLLLTSERTEIQILELKI